MAANLGMYQRVTYGVDAPATLAGIALTVPVCGVLVWASVVWRLPLVVGAWWLALAVVTFVMTCCYMHTTLVGRHRVWDELVAWLALRGDERVLDLGCGHGLVLVRLARQLQEGRVLGVDQWREDTQHGDSPAAVARNARLAGVLERVVLRSTPLTDLPLQNDAVDLVVSNLALHRFGGAAHQERVLSEAVRVLRPGGLLALTDFQHTRRYAKVLRGLGMHEVNTRGLGWRYWFGGPFTGTTLVTARKPSRAS